MIRPTRLQIALAKNSKPSSQRNRLVARSSEPLAVSRESHILSCVRPAEVPLPRPTKLISTITYSLRSLRRLRLTNQNP